MKLFAILYDSYREAIDGKIFYVMMGLIGVIVVTALSLTFEALPPEEAFKSLIPKFSRVYEANTRQRSHYMGAGYKVENVEVVERKGWGPSGTYRLTMSARPEMFFQAVTIWKFGMPPSYPIEIHKDAMQPEVMAEFLTEQFLIHGGMEAKPRVVSDPKKLSFEVDVEVEDPRGWLYEPQVFFGAIPLRRLPLFTPFKDSFGRCVYDLEDSIVNSVGAWVILLTGIVVTSFFVPSMLQKGTIEPLLVRPIRRTTLLVYKYIGGLSFVLLNVSMLVVGLWLAIGLRTGIWAADVLISIPIITYYFAVFYSVSVLIGVVTRNGVLSIIGTCGIWFLVFAVGYLFLALEPFYRDPEKPLPANMANLPRWLYPTLDKLHWFLPRVKDLEKLVSERLQTNTVTEGERRGLRKVDSSNINVAESLVASTAFIAFMLGLACWWFATKDY